MTSPLPGVDLCLHLPPTTSTQEQHRRDQGHPRIAILPVGSLEQHGGHLPLTTDTVIAQLVAQALSQTYHLWLLPALPYGCSTEHGDFAGTVSITSSTLEGVLEQIRNEVHANGIDQLVVANCHGGNYLEAYATAVNLQARRAHAPRATTQPTRPPVVLYPDHQAQSQAREAAGCPPGDVDMHAGDYETSIMLAYAPALVDPSYREADYLVDDWAQDLHLIGTRGHSPTGVIGLPSQASADKGRVIMHSLINGFKARLDLMTYPTPLPSHLTRRRELLSCAVPPSPSAHQH